VVIWKACRTRAWLCPRDGGPGGLRDVVVSYQAVAWTRGAAILGGMAPVIPCRAEVQQKLRDGEIEDQGSQWHGDPAWPKRQGSWWCVDPVQPKRWGYQQGVDSAQPRSCGSGQGMDLVIPRGAGTHKILRCGGSRHRWPGRSWIRCGARVWYLLRCRNPGGGGAWIRCRAVAQHIPWWGESGIVKQQLCRPIWWGLHRPALLLLDCGMEKPSMI
jgi:hypothetical protein